MRRSISGGLLAAAALMALAVPARAQLPRSQPEDNPYAGNPYRGPLSPTYYRIGSYYNGPYAPILFHMGNPYSGPADPNCGQPYFGSGYVANLTCPPLGANAYYSPYYNNTTGTYYGPSSQLQQGFMILHEPPPGFPPGFQGR